eukprot:scaffold229492_cov17-Prasinocladus_malaysianus.AAC.1
MHSARFMQQAKPNCQAYCPHVQRFFSGAHKRRKAKGNFGLHNLAQTNSICISLYFKCLTSGFLQPSHMMPFIQLAADN